MLLKSVQLPVDTILSYSPILHMCVSRLTIQKDSSHCAWGLGRYCPAGCHFPHGAGIGDFTTGLLAPFVAYAWYSGNLCAQRRDLVEPLWRGRSRQCCGVEGAHQRRRGRHRLPDRAHPGVWRAARVPHPLLFIDWPAAQNLATAAASGVAALRYGRGDVTDRVTGLRIRADDLSFQTVRSFRAAGASKPFWLFFTRRCMKAGPTDV